LAPRDAREGWFDVSETQRQINHAEAPRKWTPARRTVLVVLLVIAGGWLASVLVQLPAILKVWSLEGDVYCRLGHVVSVRFDEVSRFSDSDIAWLHWLPYLENLDLTDTDVSADGLEQLTQLDRLQVLTILADRIPPDTERELVRENPELFVEKIHVINGRRVVDGWE
jgi:hypothetical protein